MGPELDSTDALVRDTYVHFAVAMFRAQNLETDIVNAMIIARLPEKDHVTMQEIDAFRDQQFTYTLGKLIRELKKYVSVHDELEQTLSEALKKRNWLAHDYFRERALELISSAGCNLMISELVSAQHLFWDSARTLNMAVKPIRERFGLTDEVLEQEFERHCRRVLAR